MLDEIGREAPQRVDVLDQRSIGALVGLVEDRADGPRRGGLDAGRHRPARARDEEPEVAAARRAAVGGLRVAPHPPLRDHDRREAVRLVEVVAGAAGHLVEQQLLGRSPAHQRHEPGAQVGFGRKVVVLLRADRDAECVAVGEQADLLDLALVAMDAAADRVADLVGRDDRTLTLVHRPAAGRADRDLQPARVDVGRSDRHGAASGGDDGGLVEQVAQLGAGEAVGAASQRVEIDLGRERLAHRVDRQDRAATGHVRQADVDLPVEPTGTKDRLVEDVDPVRRGDDDDLVGRREAVELDEQLVERLLALFVAVRPAAAPADRVELVDEDHAAAELARAGEQLAHPTGADADELLDELGARRVVERDAGLRRDGAGEHRLAGSGRAKEHDAARDVGAEQAEALGGLEELDHLGQLELRLVAARHVGQVDRTGVAGVARRRSGRIVGGRRQDRPEPARGVTAGRTGPVHAQDEERQHGQERQGNDQADDGADRVDGGRGGLTGHDDDVSAGACVLLERFERRGVEGDLTARPGCQPIASAQPRRGRRRGPRPRWRPR